MPLAAELGYQVTASSPTRALLVSGEGRLTVPVRTAGGQSLVALRSLTTLPGVRTELKTGALTLQRGERRFTLPLDLAGLLPWTPQPEFPPTLRR